MLGRLREVCGIVTVVALAAMASSPAVGGEIENADQAIARALRFFEDVGWEPENDGRFPEREPTAVFPARWPRENCWEVNFVNLTADVDRETGAVHDATKGKLVQPRTGDWVPISESSANQRAVECLEAGGLSLHNAHLLSSALTRDRDQWRVRFRRVHNGFLFDRSDSILVILDPEEGSLIGYGYNFWSPLPDSTRVVVGEDEAVQLAREYLAELWLEAGDLRSAEVWIVQPDDYWEYEAVNEIPPAWELRVAASSRLAWEVIFDAPWRGTVVWIDSETGAALGGKHTRSMPKGDVEIRRPASADTRKITIERADGSGEPVILAAVSAEGQRLLAAIGELRGAKAPECDLPIRLRFDAEERSYLLGYSPEADRLVLLEKRYRGKTIKGGLAWEVSEELERLLSRYVD